MAKALNTDKVQIAWVPDEGCFRTVTQRIEKATVGGVEVAVEVSDFGDKVIWVDDAPNDVNDGAGHFEAYTGTDDDYLPQVAADQE